MTFTFSEAPTGFTDADLDVVGGTITDLVATVDPLVWTAQFTATDGFTGTGSVTVVSDSYTDAALNLGGSGTDSVTVDRTNPTVTVAIADGSLSDTDSSSLVTFTFSEAPTGFTDADLDVVGGTITDLVATVDPLVWTAQFTATDGFAGAGSVAVVADSYTDAALNLGGSGSDSVTVDRTNPTVTVAIAESSLSDGTASSPVTFTFSEAPTSFTDADLDVVGGTITDLVATVDPSGVDGAVHGDRWVHGHGLGDGRLRQLHRRGAEPGRFGQRQRYDRPDQSDGYGRDCGNPR